MIMRANMLDVLAWLSVSYFLSRSLLEIYSLASMLCMITPGTRSARSTLDFGLTRVRAEVRARVRASACARASISCYHGDHVYRVWIPNPNFEVESESLNSLCSSDVNSGDGIQRARMQSNVQRMRWQAATPLGDSRRYKFTRPNRSSQSSDVQTSLTMLHCISFSFIYLFNLQQSRHSCLLTTRARYAGARLRASVRARVNLRYDYANSAYSVVRNLLNTYPFKSVGMSLWVVTRVSPWKFTQFLTFRCT
jgi:hypothetical protein